MTKFPNNEPPTLDITVQRSEFNKSIEIEINPRLRGHSTYHAKATEHDQPQLEDGDDHPMDQNVKK